VSFFETISAWEIFKKQEAHGACIPHLFSLSKLFEGFCYTRDLKLESPCPKDTPCQISMHANGS